MATIIIVMFLISSGPVTPAFVQAQENDQTISLAAPNWVHPARRNNYPGYAKHKEQKQDSSIWQYSTNRPLGNIQGGGTTRVEDYKPFHQPTKPKKQ